MGELPKGGSLFIWGEVHARVQADIPTTRARTRMRGLLASCRNPKIALSGESTAEIEASQDSLRRHR